MNVNQWAAICTIHIEPEYRFIGEERELAERMVRVGYLKRKSTNIFRVTAKGEREYARFRSEEE